MASGLIFDDDGNDVTMETLADPYEIPDPPTTPGAVWGSYAVYLDELRALVTRLTAERNTPPGPLTWKFDGGRGAMLNENRRIVGYWRPPARYNETDHDRETRQEVVDEIVEALKTEARLSTSAHERDCYEDAARIAQEKGQA